LFQLYSSWGEENKLKITQPMQITFKNFVKRLLVKVLVICFAELMVREEF
jgi:hypothetical protein